MDGREHIIEVKDMVKKFGSFTANDRLTFYVEQGEIFGFLGANGAGKTTAIRILCGLSYPSSGEIRVAGSRPGTEWSQTPVRPTPPDDGDRYCLQRK